MLTLAQLAMSIIIAFTLGKNVTHDGWTPWNIFGAAISFALAMFVMARVWERNA